jgi:hypothetical protein
MAASTWRWTKLIVGCPEYYLLHFAFFERFGGRRRDVQATFCFVYASKRSAAKDNAHLETEPKRVEQHSRKVHRFNDKQIAWLEWRALDWGSFARCVFVFLFG